MVGSFIGKRIKSDTKIVPSMNAHCLKNYTQKFETMLTSAWASETATKTLFSLLKLSWIKKWRNVGWESEILTVFRVKWGQWDATTPALECGHFSRAASRPLAAPFWTSHTRKLRLRIKNDTLGFGLTLTRFIVTFQHLKHHVANMTQFAMWG